MDDKKTIDYNEEPVLYCARCYSLNIRDVDGVPDSDYCKDCSCTDIRETSIFSWERMYQMRYGHKLVERRK